MAEGNKTMLFVGLGCGALALLGLCVGGGAAVFFFTARSEAPGPVAVGTPTSASATPPGYRTVSGPTWSFAVPMGWEDISLPAPVVSSARATSSANGFLTNVNLVTEPFYGDPASYGASNVALLQSVGTVTIISQTPSTVGALPGLDIEAQWPTNAPPTHTLQRFTASGGTGYAFTCSGSLGDFESVRAQCNEILATLNVQ